MKTLRGGILAAALLAILTACGGGQAAAPKADSGSNAGTAAAAASADANAGAVANAGKAAASGTNISITGDKPFTVSTEGSCSISTLLGTEDWGGSFETDGDDFWMLTLDVRKFAGPGTYDIVKGEIVGKGRVNLTDMAGTSSASVKGGTLTVGEGGTSGSVEADLDGSAGKMHVSGSFTCEMD